MEIISIDVWTDIGDSVDNYEGTLLVKTELSRGKISNELAIALEYEKENNDEYNIDSVIERFIEKMCDHIEVLKHEAVTLVI